MWFISMLAYVLLYSTTEPLEAANVADVPSVQIELQRLAVIEGVVDEGKHYIGSSNLQAIRYMVRVQRGWPPEWARLAFPQDRDWAMANWHLARGFRDECLRQLDLPGTLREEYDRLTKLHDEAERRVRAWNALADMGYTTRTDCGIRYWRRCCLERLRAEIGQDDLNAGRMPSPLPLLTHK